MSSRKENFVLAIVVTIAMIIGINQLSRDNDIFAETLVYCCNAGYCHDMPCSETSSIRKGANCTDYISTCEMCIEMIPQLMVECGYSGPNPSWCNY